MTALSAIVSNGGRLSATQKLAFSNASALVAGPPDLVKKGRGRLFKQTVKPPTPSPSVKGQKDGETVTIPRDPDGRVTHWVEGMSLCNCNGKHLFRDCPTEGKKDKQSGHFADNTFGYLNCSLEKWSPKFSFPL